jgi:HlyD family secretion protein
MRNFIKIAFGVIVVGGILAAVISGFMPQPIVVDLATVSRGPLRVSVDEDGKTRIRYRYVIAAPLAGQLQRVTLRPGDSVSAQQTVAQIRPMHPELVDAPMRRQAELRVVSAQLAMQQAEANLAKADEASRFAKSEVERLEDAVRRNKSVITDQELDEKRMHDRVRQEEARALKTALQIAAYELKLAEAAQERTRLLSPSVSDSWAFDVGSPIGGRVLRVFQESESPVTSGQRLMEIGDPAQLEVEIDVLSSDAVKIQPGAKVWLEQWGGDAPLEARVRLVEPSGFTKVSALGVEEQRVNVIADLVTPFEQRSGLGDGFRVEARIVVWEQLDVLRVPTSALFRSGDSWSVFVVKAGKASLRTVELGQRNGIDAQILSGLVEGEWVILHPGDRLRDNAPVSIRK